MRLRFVNNAIVVMGATDQSSSASYDDIKPLMDRAKDAAEFYRQRCIDYLRDKGTAAFPEYGQNSDAGELSATARNYYAGINLDSNVPRSNRMKSFLQGAGITIYGC
jgi:hypothetical protein